MLLNICAYDSRYSSRASFYASSISCYSFSCFSERICVYVLRLFAFDLSMLAPAPLSTKKSTTVKERRELLTRDGRRLLERSVDILIHFNVHSGLNCYFLVPLIDLVLDPIGEVLFEYGVRYVCNPLLRQLLDFLIHREVDERLRLLLHEGEELFD